MNDRLYGIPGAEEMYFTLAGAYEAQIEPYDCRDPHEIEEWIASDPRSFLVDAETLIEWATEAIPDCGDAIEGTYDAFEAAGGSESVRQAFEHALALWADLVTYRQAESLVRTWTIMWDAGGNPLADGSPIYTEESTTAEPSVKS